MSRDGRCVPFIQNECNNNANASQKARMMACMCKRGGCLARGFQPFGIFKFIRIGSPETLSGIFLHQGKRKIQHSQEHWICTISDAHWVTDFRHQSEVGSTSLSGDGRRSYLSDQTLHLHQHTRIENSKLSSKAAKPEPRSRGLPAGAAALPSNCTPCQDAIAEFTPIVCRVMLCDDEACGKPSAFFRRIRLCCVARDCTIIQKETYGTFWRYGLTYNSTRFHRDRICELANNHTVSSRDKAGCRQTRRQTAIGWYVMRRPYRTVHVLYIASAQKASLL